MNIDTITIEVAKLELKPGDVLLVKIPPPQFMTMAQQRSLQEHISRVFPGVKLLVMPQNFEVSIVSEADNEDHERLADHSADSSASHRHSSAGSQTSAPP